MNRQFSLLEPFEALGRWWHPDNATHKVMGTLNFHPGGGITLDLTESIVPSLPPNAHLQSHGTIFGQLLDGPICTLELNTAVSRSHRGSEVVSERYSSKYLLLGVHQEAFEHSDYTQLYVQFTNIEYWIDRHPVSLGALPEREHGQRVDYDQFKVIFQYHLDSRNCEIILLRMAERHTDIRSMSLKFHHELVLRPSEPQDFFWYQELMRDIRNLLVLFTVSPIYQIKMRMEVITREQKNVTFDVFFAQPNLRNVEVGYRDMLLRLEDVKVGLPIILDQWISLADRVRPVHDLFFGYIYRPDGFVAFRFLSLTQALETYHRSTGTGQFVSKELYDQILSLLVGCLTNEMDNDLRRALISRLKYGNEHSLRRRLKELFGMLSEDGRRLIDSNWKDFIGQVVDYRNYLTHYDVESKPSGFREQRLFSMCEQLRSLLTLLLLKEIGIEEEKSIPVIQNHPSLWPWQ